MNERMPVSANRLLTKPAPANSLCPFLRSTLVLASKDFSNQIILVRGCGPSNSRVPKQVNKKLLTGTVPVNNLYKLN